MLDFQCDNWEIMIYKKWGLIGKKFFSLWGSCLQNMFVYVSGDLFNLLTSELLGVTVTLNCSLAFCSTVWALPHIHTSTMMLYRQRSSCKPQALKTPKLGVKGISFLCIVSMPQVYIVTKKLTNAIFLESHI